MCWWWGPRRKVAKRSVSRDERESERNINLVECLLLRWHITEFTTSLHLQPASTRSYWLVEILVSHWSKHVGYISKSSIVHWPRQRRRPFPLEKSRRLQRIRSSLREHTRKRLLPKRRPLWIWRSTLSPTGYDIGGTTFHPPERPRLWHQLRSGQANSSLPRHGPRPVRQRNRLGLSVRLYKEGRYDNPRPERHRRSSLQGGRYGYSRWRWLVRSWRRQRTLLSSRPFSRLTPTVSLCRNRPPQLRRSIRQIAVSKRKRRASRRERVMDQDGVHHTNAIQVFDITADGTWVYYI